MHLVDVSGASGRDPAADLETLRRELELFAPSLAEKPQIVAANKIDAATDRDGAGALAAGAKALDLPYLQISAATGEGVAGLLEAMWRRLASPRPDIVSRSTHV